MKYFAYGSNMLTRRLTDPSPRTVGRRVRGRAGPGVHRAVPQGRGGRFGEMHAHRGRWRSNGGVWRAVRGSGDRQRESRQSGRGTHGRLRPALRGGPPCGRTHDERHDLCGRRAAYRRVARPRSTGTAILSSPVRSSTACRRTTSRNWRGCRRCRIRTPPEPPAHAGCSAVHDGAVCAAVAASTRGRHSTPVGHKQRWPNATASYKSSRTAPRCTIGISRRASSRSDSTKTAFETSGAVQIAEPRSTKSRKTTRTSWQKLDTALAASGTCCSTWGDVETPSLEPLRTLTGISSIHWQDHKETLDRSTLAPTVRELVGLEFLDAQDPARQEWERRWPQSGTVHNWDAVGQGLTHDRQTWILIEAKAHVGELRSRCGANVGNEPSQDSDSARRHPA